MVWKFSDAKMVECAVAQRRLRNSFRELGNTFRKEIKLNSNEDGSVDDRSFQVHPDWNMDENFVRGTVRSVFQVDANNKVRPMTHYVEKPQSIQGLFDNIAYAKCE